MKRIAGALVLVPLVLGACSFAGGSGRTYQAEFSRAVQVFPGVAVQVLGVRVGTVTDIRNVPGGVVITFLVEDESTKIPAGVNAAIVPQSLLGERFIQLFPAYRGGPQLSVGATIPLARTGVPAEPDELLQSIQTYLGAVDNKALERFVDNAAQVLEGNGENLNQVIHNAAGIISTLSAKRDDLADLVVELNKLTLALASRQQEVGSLIESYNEVATTLTDNRKALEGTVTGLSEATFQLASLLTEHRVELDSDLDTLTQTARTLDRNVKYIVNANRWSRDLFSVIERSWDIVATHRWIPLNNQGMPLAELILQRLEERLIELCQDAGAPECATKQYWASNVPSLFCFEPPCPEVKGSPAEQLERAIDGVPAVRNEIDESNQSEESTGTVETVLNKLPHGVVP